MKKMLNTRILFLALVMLTIAHAQEELSLPLVSLELTDPTPTGATVRIINNSDRTLLINKAALRWPLISGYDVPADTSESATIEGRVFSFGWGSTARGSSKSEFASLAEDRAELTELKPSEVYETVLPLRDYMEPFLGLWKQEVPSTFMISVSFRRLVVGVKGDAASRELFDTRYESNEEEWTPAWRDKKAEEKIRDRAIE